MIRMKNKMRNIKLDNCKAILIILVVIGHMLETKLGYGINRYLYILIYLFHMPFFSYLTGYFANRKPSKWFKNLICPYLLFQTLYLLFEHYILGKTSAFQYTTPYWIMWYLFAVLVWNLFVFFIGKTKLTIQKLILAGTVILSLLIGYADIIGREFSLSRIFVFFPFFLGGYISHQGEKKLLQSRKTEDRKIEQHKNNKRITMLLGGALIIIGIGTILQEHQISLNGLYEANSYRLGNYGIGFRAFHLLSASIWIAFLLRVIPDKKIAGISQLGKNTMPIYLIHGFLIKWIGTV